MFIFSQADRVMAKLIALEKSPPALVKSYLQANNKLAEYGGGSAKLVW